MPGLRGRYRVKVSVAKGRQVGLSFPATASGLRNASATESRDTQSGADRFGRRPVRGGRSDIVTGRIPMRKFPLVSCLGALAIFAGGAAQANDDLIKMSKNPNDWVTPTGDYATQRYSP